MRADWHDAWFGTIASVKSGLEIKYSAGSAEKPDLKQTEKFLWTRSRAIEGSELVYVLEQKGTEQWLHAEFNLLNFSAKTAGDDEIEEVLSIISTVRSGACKSCMKDRTARNFYLGWAKRAGFVNKRIEEISKRIL